jgi:hypothetical protein
LGIDLSNNHSSKPKEIQMRRSHLISVVVLGCALASAQDEAEPRSATKQIESTCSGLGKKITAEDAGSWKVK